MRVVITGGTGLIGRALSANLAADSHEVIVLSRSPERATDLPEGVRAERWDARTAEGWGHLADGAGAIVNLAGANLAGGGFLPLPQPRRAERQSAPASPTRLCARVDTQPDARGACACEPASRAWG